MAKYLIHGTYVGDGVRGLLKEGGSSRRAVVETVTKSVGGSVEALYFGVGEAAVYIIVDVADNIRLSAVTLTAVAAGGVTIKTVALISAEELDEATKLSPAYHAPGQ
jgi:uncharacterized protein with GYD domain